MAIAKRWVTCAPRLHQQCTTRTCPSPLLATPALRYHSGKLFFAGWPQRRHERSPLPPIDAWCTGSKTARVAKLWESHESESCPGFQPALLPISAKWPGTDGREKHNTCFPIHPDTQSEKHREIHASGCHCVHQMCVTERGGIACGSFKRPPATQKSQPSNPARAASKCTSRWNHQLCTNCHGLRPYRGITGVLAAHRCSHHRRQQWKVNHGQAPEALMRTCKMRRRMCGSLHLAFEVLRLLQAPTAWLRGRTRRLNRCPWSGRSAAEWLLNKVHVL